MNGNIKKEIITLFWCILLVLLLNTPNKATGRKDTSRLINFDTAYNTNAGNQVLATVGNHKITVREFLSSYEFGPAFTKREKHSKSLYLKYMINEKLLALDGYSQGLDTTKEVNNILNAISGDLASDQMFMDKIFNKIKVPKTELDSALEEKQITYNIKWLFAPDKDSLNFYESKLHSGISFDSLFALQLKDSVYSDQRSMSMDKFKLHSRNPVLAKVVDTLKVNQISNPVKAPDGYYIVKLADVWRNEIVTQSKKDKEIHDARLVIKRDKSDAISNVYVRKLMLKHNPVIKGKAFDILRSYLGSYILPKKKYDDWNLGKRLRKEFSQLKTKDYKDIKLVSLNDGELTLDDFINWYKVRENYLKFDQKNFNSFSASLERTVWQMVRDHLLVGQAYSEGYQNKEIVKQQINWWRDKIVYAVVRDKLANSVGLNIESPTSLQSKYKNNKQKLQAKVLHKVLALRQKYKININKKLLNDIEVQTQDDPKAVEFYIVKKGGTYPHPAYPSIDFSWQSWE